MRYEPRNFYLRSTEEMEELFGAYPDAVANTQRIADRCQMEFTFGKYHLPEFRLPPGVDSPDLSAAAVRKGVRPSATATEHEDYRRQLDYELDMIETHGLYGLFPHRVGFRPIRQGCRYPRGTGPRLGGGQHGAPTACASRTSTPCSTTCILSAS